MGRIAVANVLSDLYAMGCVECDNMLMLLGVSTKLKDNERDVAIGLMIRGFKDAAAEAGTSVQGGQTVLNPWIVIGGVASCVALPSEFIMPDGAVPGDVLVLTKPLGTQVAVNLYQWMLDKSPNWARLRGTFTEEDVRRAYQRAVEQMARLNRRAAQLLHRYSAHACTDVTGFGLLGHARNLAACQRAPVNLVIHNLPILARMAAVSKALGGAFGLLAGTSAETSGGLLVALSREQGAAFCRDMEAEGAPGGSACTAWIVGVVESGNGGARIIDKPRVIEVPAKGDADGAQLW